MTDKPEPGDIDLVIVLPQGYNFGAELPPFQYNAVSKRGLRRRYGFDVFVAEVDSLEYEGWMKLFQADNRPPPRRKGVLRIAL